MIVTEYTREQALTELRYRMERVFVWIVYYGDQVMAEYERGKKHRNFIGKGCEWDRYIDSATVALKKQHKEYRKLQDMYNEISCSSNDKFFLTSDKE